jgi:uncharacterized protein (TIRG00374 family)
VRKRLVALAVSIALLALIWFWVDPAAIWAAIQGVSPGWFWSAVLFSIPLTLATALRFRILSAARISIGQSVRLILAASTLNMVLPSKMGDIAKAWILRQRNDLSGGQALALVVLEKLLDLWALLAVGVFCLSVARPPVPGLPLVIAALCGGAAALLFLMLSGERSLSLVRRLTARLPALDRRVAGLASEWHALVHGFRRRPVKAVGLVAGSLLLWVGHLFQLWLFARAIGDVPPGISMALSVIAILAGLLPFTFAGIGTRDAAFVLLFGPFLGTGGAALLGLFATLRYLLPALAGLPFVSDFWSARSEQKGS